MRHFVSTAFKMTVTAGLHTLQVRVDAAASRAREERGSDDLNKEFVAEYADLLKRIVT